MNENRLDTQHISNQASVLPACATKTIHRVAGDIIAPLDRDFFDRIGHVFNRDTQEPLRQLFRRHFWVTGLGCHLPRQR